MLTTMSEKKDRKVVEFKIVKSPLNDISRSTASACSPVPKIKKRENSKNKKTTSKSDNGVCHQKSLNLIMTCFDEPTSNTSKQESDTQVRAY